MDTVQKVDELLAQQHKESTIFSSFPSVLGNANEIRN